MLHISICHQLVAAWRVKAGYLFAFRDIDFHELMNRFFKVELVVSNFSQILKVTYRVHDGQINRPSEIDQIRFSHIHNSLLFWRNGLVIRIIRILFTSRLSTLVI